jgi:hypothetical protein
MLTFEESEWKVYENSLYYASTLCISRTWDENHNPGWHLFSPEKPWAEDPGVPCLDFRLTHGNMCLCVCLIQSTGGFPGGSVVENPSASARDTGEVGLIPGSGRSPGEANGNPLQYSCWRIRWTEEPGSLQSMGVAKSWTWLSMHTCVTSIWNGRRGRLKRQCR